MLLVFLVTVVLIAGAFTWFLTWAHEASEYMAKKKAEEEEAKRIEAYRPAFLAGFNFAVGKGGLPPEITNWPSALKEVIPDDPNCS